MQGLVIDGSNNFFTVECEDGITRTCSLKGKKLKASEGYYNPLAPGDQVILDEDSLDEKKGQITDLAKRKNEFVRWNVKKRLPQLLAANLDYLLIVTTPDMPPFRPRFIDRAIAQAEYENITPVIICNKYDLRPEDDEAIQNRLNSWEKTGYKVLRVSAKTGEGMTELAELLQDHLSALVGQSGVGKSSLINVLDNNCVLKTGSLSQKYGRGTHTTTKGTLIHLEISESLTGGIKGAVADIIDTPGVRRFMLHDISPENLQLYYKDFAPFLGKCEFGMSCTHLSESGCKIIEAVNNGDIDADRYESWKRITEEMRTGRWDD